MAKQPAIKFPQRALEPALLKEGWLWTKTEEGHLWRTPVPEGAGEGFYRLEDYLRGKRFDQLMLEDGEVYARRGGAHVRVPRMERAPEEPPDFPRGMRPLGLALLGRGDRALLKAAKDRPQGAAVFLRPEGRLLAYAPYIVLTERVYRLPVDRLVALPAEGYLLAAGAKDPEARWYQLEDGTLALAARRDGGQVVVLEDREQAERAREDLEKIDRLMEEAERRIAYPSALGTKKRLEALAKRAPVIRYREGEAWIEEKRTGLKAPHAPEVALSLPTLALAVGFVGDGYTTYAGEKALRLVSSDQNREALIPVKEEER